MKASCGGPTEKGKLDMRGPHGGSLAIPQCSTFADASSAHGKGKGKRKGEKGIASLYLDARGGIAIDAVIKCHVYLVHQLVGLRFMS